MSGDVWSWILTFLVGLGVVLLLVIAVNRFFRVVQTMTAELYCPRVDRSVKVKYLTLDGRRPVSVLSCTAFAGTTGVLCGMPCLAWGERAGPEDQKEHVLDLLNDRDEA